MFDPDQLLQDLELSRGELVLVKPSPLPKPVARHPTVAQLVVTGAGLALGVVGLTINAWFAQSLGSTEIAGWLFAGIGVASDGAALVLPCQATRLWSRSQLAALVAWLLWLLTFAFALVASIGFAGLNITDTTMTRTLRLTPEVELAQRTLDTLSRSREDECKRRGPLCRELEAKEQSALVALREARNRVAVDGDPQATKAAALVRWLTFGLVRPGAEDLAMFRLALLTLLPQLGGLMLMVARR